MWWLRPAGLIIVALVAFLVAALLLPHSPTDLRALLSGVGPVAVPILLAAWIVLTPALFPGTLLAAAGGLAFGAFGGSVLAIAGAVAGGLAAFALGRTVARRPVQRLVEGKPRLTRLHTLLERRGFAAVLAARLMPGVPAGGLHYAAGISPVRPRSFVAAMALGAVLRTVPYAMLGQGLGSGSITGILVATASIGIGGVIAAVLVRQMRRAPATA